MENLKSVLPTKHSDDKEKYDSTDAKRKNSRESIDSTSNTAEHPSLIDKVKNKIKRSSSPTNTMEQEKQPQPYERLWQSASQSPQGRR